MSSPYLLPIDKVLDKLDRVRAKRPSKEGLNQWQAVCPAHQDKSPSLIITECLDGTVLLKCWAGCSANEVVRAIGLELKDLFKDEPTRVSHSGNSNSYKPIKKLKLPSKRAIKHEKLIISIAESILSKGQALNTSDYQRYQLALQRIKKLQYVKYP